MKEQERTKKVGVRQGNTARAVWVIVPFAILAAVVVACVVWVRVLPLGIVAIAGMPFAILGMGSLLTVMLRRAENGLVLIAVGAAALSAYYALVIVESSGPLPAADIRYLSPAQTIGMGFAGLGVLFGIVSLVYVAVVLAMVGPRGSGRLGGCAKCGYDRAGIGVDAKCPECGAGLESG